MIRKLLLVAAATAMPLGFIAATGGLATASTPPVNATTATVTCTGITGTAKFSPAVTTNEAAGPSTTSIKAVLTGCTTNDGVTVTGAKVAGSLSSTRTANENGCVALAESSSSVGNLTTKWKTTPKLTAPSSTIAVNSIAGSVGGNGHADFTIPGTTPNGAASGSFQGLNGGASDTTTAQSTATAATILSTCEGKKGLKSFTFTSPVSGNAVSLG
jgi:hypothetical protein